MKKTNEILILKSGCNDFENYYIEHMQREHIKTYAIYDTEKGIRWKIIWLWKEIFNLPFSHIWYGEWKKTIQNYDVVIVFDNNLNWNILEYIKKKNPNAKIIAWYWNVITKEKWNIPNKYRAICDVWSFDQSDCIKYKMKKNIQFYDGELQENNQEIKYCAMFVGKDKGRYALVTEIQKILEKNGLRTFINIVADKKKTFINARCRMSEKRYKSAITYQEIVKKIKESRCIIDIPQPGQVGMTVRVLEALFYQKKLITTDITLRDKEWFCEDNIYILGDELKEQEILDFLSIPYNEMDKVNCMEYSFDTWIKNFQIS